MMLVRFWLLILVVISAAVGLCAETRFGRPVVKLAGDQEFSYVQLDGKVFPVESRGSISVSCMTYRGRQRYYVEVAISTKSARAISLAKGFVNFEKLGYTVFVTSTLSSAEEVRAAMAGPYIPAPPPINTTTTYSGTAVTTGDITTLNGSVQTTDNSGWYRLGQAIAAQRYYRAQSQEQSFATYLETFANERQPLIIEPNGVQLYVFTFQQLRPKKKPFTIKVRVGQDEFPFSYRE